MRTVMIGILALGLTTTGALAQTSGSGSFGLWHHVVGYHVTGNVGRQGIAGGGHDTERPGDTQPQQYRHLPTFAPAAAYAGLDGHADAGGRQHAGQFGHRHRRRARRAPQARRPRPTRRDQPLRAGRRPPRRMARRPRPPMVSRGQAARPVPRGRSSPTARRRAGAAPPHARARIHPTRPWPTA